MIIFIESIGECISQPIFSLNFELSVGYDYDYDWLWSVFVFLQLFLFEIFVPKIVEVHTGGGVFLHSFSFCTSERDNKYFSVFYSAISPI